ncbi:hypothetical protein GW579_15715 [Rahnella sp. Lac-M11]|uniref:Uncharacterized protein n=1 Tax=Rahnella contaminans TaxID=2703882 RepID=A0A6M2B670_9GAMM|nr:hypothetical protein [Rahnella contaminans]NGX88525.1 hypothetical protein [Rahnella contaminans]
MGWSVPQAESQQKPPAWSPWVCVFIFMTAFALALVWVVLDTPSTGLYPLSSGHYLPLTGFTLVGILSCLSLYLLIWEAGALMYYSWTHWQANTNAAWQNWTHQHLHIVDSVNFTTRQHLYPQVAGLSRPEGDNEEPAVLLFPEDDAPPGIYRFEIICRHILTSFEDAIKALNLPKQVTFKFYVQTQTEVTETHVLYLEELWQTLYPGYSLQVNPVRPQASLETVGTCLDAHAPCLVIAMQYYDGVDEKPLSEIATGLLLSPADLLRPDTLQNAPQLFRAMPLNLKKLPEDLLELRDMTQQPAESLRLLWFSGLTDILRQKLNAVVHDVKLPLRKEAPMGGQLDFDKGCGMYGSLSGWLMIGAAADMIKRGQGSQWVLTTTEESAWAVVVGDQAPFQTDYHSQLPRDVYPAGCLVASLLFNLVLFWSLGNAFPDWLFSFWGAITLILTLVVTMTGSAVGLRIVLNRLLEPHFIRSAQQGS